MYSQSEPLTTWSDTSLDLESFFDHAQSFKQKLNECHSFNELHAVWQKTRLPYSMPQIDPNSERYLSDVKKIYEALTEKEYQTSNELCTTKMDTIDFKKGFPWSTKRLDIISAEMSKVVQALRAFHNQDGLTRVIEFGAGWGNLAIPMARSGLDVTVVDIDGGFLDRIIDLARRSDLHVETIHADFINAANSVFERYDAVVFQSSFHHCIEFDKLVGLLKERVLTDNGILYFFSEPIFDNYQFPWGLRFDGESLWAIMQNNWLELGFDRSFFSELMLKHGMFLCEIPAVPGIVGCGYRGVPLKTSLPFEQWVLPSASDKSFHPSHGELKNGRFCRDVSVLPENTSSKTNYYEITFRCMNSSQLKFYVSNSDESREITLEPSESVSVKIRSGNGDITINSDTFVPAVTIGNGDTRVLGVSIMDIACF